MRGFHLGRWKRRHNHGYGHNCSGGYGQGLPVLLGVGDASMSCARVGVSLLPGEFHPFRVQEPFRGSAGVILGTGLWIMCSFFRAMQIMKEHLPFVHPLEASPGLWGSGKQQILLGMCKAQCWVVGLKQPSPAVLGR